jgi:adenylate kinase family enzyme
MKKILIIGSGGAGKSTLSRQLGNILNLEVIHLDSLYWHPGWVETPKPEWGQFVVRTKVQCHGKSLDRSA